MPLAGGLDLLRTGTAILGWGLDSASSLAVLLEVGDEVPDLGGFLGGAGAGALVVVEGGAGVLQRVLPGRPALEGGGRCCSGLPGAVDVPPGFIVRDGLLEVVQGLPGVPGIAIDDAELLSTAARSSAARRGSGPGPAGSRAGPC